GGRPARRRAGGAGGGRRLTRGLAAPLVEDAGAQGTLRLDGGNQEHAAEVVGAGAAGEVVDVEVGDRGGDDRAAPVEHRVVAPGEEGAGGQRLDSRCRVGYAGLAEQLAVFVGEAVAAEEVGAAGAGAQQRLLPAPATDLLVVAGEQHGRHAGAAQLGG